MNYRMIFHMLGIVLFCLAALMIFPVIVALCFGESCMAFVIVIALTLAAAAVFFSIKPKTNRIFAREGFAIVSLSWILISLLGALPFCISGDIPSYVDAFFETVSGFTTTGATIINDIEGLSRACAFWRPFTHWIGGMGFLVFVMAVLPLSGEHSMHIMRAEVPGPVVDKLVPKAKKSAMTLYLIYVVLTLVEAVFLMAGGMSFFEALVHSFSTAGTGGFSTRQASIASFHSVYIEIVIAVFMLIFSLNFNLYFLMVRKYFREALKSEELRWFLAIVFSAVIMIAINITGYYGSFRTALRHSFFNVSSVISTTGFGTEDFDLWPETSKWILLSVMLVGGCAGSTAGGLKMSRVMIIIKSAFIDIHRMVHPRNINIVRINKTAVNRDTIEASKTYFMLYMLAIVLGALLISFDGFGVETSFTASLSCLSNVGPGMAKVGPSGNYAIFSSFSKIVLSIEMLMGRLEIYPVVILLYPQFWRAEKKIKKV